MRSLFVINDVHLGAVRAGGTTQASALALRNELLAGYARLLEQAVGCDLIVNGDLFDATNVPLYDLFAAVDITTRWLFNNPDCVLYLPPGNHDLSKNRETFSSFDFFAHNIRLQAPDRVVIPRDATYIEQHDAWVVPHMPNQDLFELELSKTSKSRYLFLHCNYDNGFATKSDHSLNLSRQQASTLLAQWIIIGHEHQRKIDGNVVIVGNQLPSSVADCLGNDYKFALRLDPGFEWVETWDSSWNFSRLDWRELATVEKTSTDFVRVEGNATAEDAAAVISIIAKFRQKSTSFVITNAVEIEGISTEEMAVSLEQIQSFNVLGELLNFLSPEQRTVVQQLLEKSRV